MANRFWDLTAPIVRLTCGPEKQVLNVPKDLLVDIPFFAKCLRPLSGFKESELNAIDLPEDDPKIISCMIEYYVTGRMISLSFWQPDSRYRRPHSGYHANKTNGLFKDDSEDPRDPGSEFYKSTSASLVEAVNMYIAADKFCAEALQNKIMDEFILHHRWAKVNPQILVILNQADMFDSPLAQLLVRVFARQFRPTNTRQAIIFSADSMQDLIPDYQEELEKLTGPIIVTLLDEIGKMVGCGQGELSWQYPKTQWEMCDWHIHEHTKACKIRSQRDTGDKRESLWPTPATAESGIFNAPLPCSKPTRIPNSVESDEE